MTMTKVSEKCPLDRDLLVRDDCFILDNGANGKIFVWKGERRLLQSPSRTSSTTVLAGLEPKPSLSLGSFYELVSFRELSPIVVSYNDARCSLTPPYS